MKIGEVSSINNSYQEQGSSAKAAPVTNASSGNGVNNQQPARMNIVDTIAEKNAEKQQLEKNENNGMTSSLRDAVSKINAASQSCEAVFGIHEATNRVMIKMVDKDTRKTIKEFPAEETLDLIAKAWELAGIMVDEKR